MFKMEDWQEDYLERKQENERMDAMRGVPYIVDVFRKHDVLATTFNYLESKRSGQLYELGRQLMNYNRTIRTICSGNHKPPRKSKDD